MPIVSKPIEYAHDGVTLEGTLAHDSAATGPLPAVLISHAWAGRTDFEIGMAERIAELGYAGFALDLYGKGVTGANNEENEKLMTPLASNRPFLQDRLAKVVDVVKSLPEVDGSKITAIGFCFGGLCVLDLARMGADLKGVAAFHGILAAPGNTEGNKISAKIAVYHGWDDPMATPADHNALAEELTRADADWQIHAYGGVMHAFTNPQANDPDFGTVFNQNAANRSWASLTSFLGECFA
ncbi:MAG: dienelactone hydrolase family protein [Pseudomonadota bacterium]